MSKSIKAISVALMGVLMLAMFVTPVAKAQSTTDVNALIAALQAQISQLKSQLGQGATTGASTFTVNLTVGSTGSEVSALQQYLIGKGYLNIAAPTGKFGAMTKNAVVALQKALGVNATGFFGPMTRAALNATVVVVPPTTTPTSTPSTGGVLTGTEGSVSLVASGYVPSGNQVNLGATDVNVAALDIKAQQGSDMKVTRFDVHFNFRPWQFLTGVKLATTDGTVLGSMQPSVSNVTEVVSGNGNGDYLVRFSGLNLVVPMNTTKTVVVRVSTPSAYAQTIPTSTKATFGPTNSDVLRVVDALGNSTAVGLSANLSNSFVLKGSQVTGSAVLSANANTPAEQIVAASKTQNTNNVEVLRFNVKAQDNAARLKTVVVNLTGSVTSSVVVANATLYDEAGNALQNATVSSTGATTANLAFDMTQAPVSIAQDQTKVFVLKINAQQASSTSNPSGMPEGATVTASVANAGLTVEDANYNNATLSGSAAGYPVRFYTIAPQISLNSAPTPSTFASSTNGAINMAQGHLIANIKAVGGDIFFSKTTAFNISANTPSNLASSTYTPTGTGVVDTGTSWKVAQDAVATVDLGYVITNTTAPKYVQAWLSGFTWGTADGSFTQNWTNMLGIGSTTAVSTQANKIAGPQVYLSI